MKTGIEKQWRAVLVDDEPPALKRLSAMLAKAAGIAVIAAYEDPMTARTAIIDDAPDVVFLDIQMPGLDGLELAATLPVPAPLIVFVTAYDQHAIRAFEVNAVDYLLKPISQQRVDATVTRIVERLTSADPHAINSRLDAVLAQLQRPIRQAAQIAVKSGGKTVLVPVDIISRAESEGNTLRVFAGKDALESRETLTAFEARLPEGMFVRISRAALVNIARVRHVEPWFHGDYVVVLLDGSKLTTGAAYRDRIRSALGLS